jgi:hypothetical protein
MPRARRVRAIHLLAFLRRTPAPPAFSSINSTPPAVKAAINNLPTDDKLLEEDIKWLATEIGLW